MPRDTACEDCPFKKLFGSCPNYVESTWIDEKTKENYLVRDCSPKRTLLMIQELYNRLLSSQIQSSQLEEKVDSQSADIKRMIQFLQYMEQNYNNDRMSRSKLASHLKNMQNLSYDNSVPTLPRSEQANCDRPRDN